MTQTSPRRDDFAGGTLIQQMRNIWSMAVQRSNLLIIVGIGPRDYDKHVWDPIAAATGEIIYIGSRSVLNDWHRCNPNVRFLNRDFRKGFLWVLLLLARAKRRHGGNAFGYLLDVFRAVRLGIGTLLPSRD